MIEIKTTDANAQAVLWALQDYLHQRLPVREYVDKRYASHDEAFRNHKIGELQDRVDRVQRFRSQLQTAVALQPKGEQA